MNNLIIFQENDLYGAKNQDGDIIIPPMYLDFYPFKYGLACVRNKKYQYSYINHHNEPLFPFGKYIWIDAEFTAGYARAKRNDNIHWTILDLAGEEIINTDYTKIWTLKSQYLPFVKAYINEVEFKIDLSKTRPVLLGLNYIVTYELPEFRERFGLDTTDSIYVKIDNKGKKFFTYGANCGEAAFKEIPSLPVISIVRNCIGQMFLLLHNSEDTGKEYYNYSCGIKTQSNNDYSVYYDSTSYEEEQQYIEDSYLDAFEGDESNYWNID